MLSYNYKCALNGQMCIIFVIIQRCMSTCLFRTDYTTGRDRYSNQFSPEDFDIFTRGNQHVHLSGHFKEAYVPCIRRLDFLQFLKPRTATTNPIINFWILEVVDHRQICRVFSHERTGDSRDASCLQKFEYGFSIEQPRDDKLTLKCL